MATSYPGGLDDFANPTPTSPMDSITVKHSAAHANLNDAVEAIQGELGVDPAGSAATVAARIAAVEAAKGKPLALTGAAAATRYVGGTASVAPTTGTFAVGDFVVTQDAKVYVCTVAGTPGTWVAASVGATGATGATGAAGAAGTDGFIVSETEPVGYPDGTVWVKVLVDPDTTPTLANESHWNTTTTSSLSTGEHTVAAGSNAVILFVGGAPGTATIEAVTFEGSAMTLIETAQSGTAVSDRLASAWILLDPPAGVGTWVVDWSAVVHHAVVVTDWANVHQTTAHSGDDNDTGSGATAASLDTSSAFPYVAFLAVRNNTSSVAAGGDQTVVTEFQGASSAQWYELTQQAAGTTAEWSWTTADTFAAVGFTIEGL